LKQHGEGLHHVRFRTDDFDRKLAALEAAGYRTVMQKRFNPTLAFAYLESPPEMGANVIELIEMR
jgi:hypothetical protein